MLIPAVLMIASLVGGDPDGIVATAPATAVDLEATARPVAQSLEGAAQAAVPHGLTTDQQIARWMTARPAADAPWVEVVHEPRDDRKVHGAASFGIGTGGYRDYGASVSLPIGETGRLDISYRQVENGYPYALYDGYGGWGPYFSPEGYLVSGYRSGAVETFDGRPSRRDRWPE